jgi:Phage capsid protein
MKKSNNLVYTTILALLSFAFAFGMQANGMDTATASLGLHPVVVPGLVAISVFSLEAFVQPTSFSNIHRADESVKRMVARYIAEQLFRIESFYTRASSTVAAADVSYVEIAQDENGITNVNLNPTKLPLELSSETDTVKSYLVDHYMTDPTLITWNETQYLTYDKIALKARKHSRSIEKFFADRIAFAWATDVSGNIIRTTGTTRPVAAALTGATGTRKALAYADLVDAFGKLTDQHLDPKECVMVVSTDLYKDLLNISEIKDWDKRGIANIISTGAVGNLFGMDVFLRSETAKYVDGTKKAWGAAGAAGDNFAAQIFHTGLVDYTKSQIKVNMDPYDVPSLGGRSMSVELRAGGSPLRTDQVGLISIVPTVVS